MSKIEYVKEENFQADVLNSALPVLVDFTASWCGPCKMLAPVLEKLAQEWQGQVDIIKVDVDHDQELAMQYQVMSIPTLILFVNGENKERLNGFRPKKRIAKKLEAYI
ncbi:MAG: thioredoxin [Chloroflexota bacterium]|nr:thioredoxin [Chloroflexota bacterium]